MSHSPVKVYAKSANSYEVRYRTPKGLERIVVQKEDLNSRVKEIRQYLDDLTVPLTPKEAADYRYAISILPAGYEGNLTSFISQLKATQELVADKSLGRRPATDAITGDVYRSYLRSCEARLLEPSTIQKKNTVLGPFIHHFAAEPVDNITTNQIRNWLDKTTGRTPGATYNTLIAEIKAFFRWTFDNNYLHTNPAGPLKGRKEVKPDHKFADAEVRDKLITAAFMKRDPCSGIFLLLGAFLGLRSSEIMRLKWKDVRVRTLYINAETAKKTSQRRGIEIDNTLRDAISVFHQMAIDKGRTDHSLVIEREKPQRYINEVLTKAAGIKYKWVRNGLRKGFVTASANTIGTEKTALLAGHSESTLRSEYLGLMSADEAVRWFELKADIFS